MVLIIKKIKAKRCDIIVIPKRSLNDMLKRHVDRIDLAGGRSNTCIVTFSGKEWTGKPSHETVVKLLLETLEKQRALEGENRYPMPHHLFHNLKCRDFDKWGSPISQVYDGDFVINLIRIKGKDKKAIAELQSYEKIGPFERVKIMNTFRKISGLCAKEFIFLAHHIHPAKRK